MKKDLSDVDLNLTKQLAEKNKLENYFINSRKGLFLP
jgi:hypothetical protein